MTVDLHIRPDDLRDARVAAFLDEHLADMRRISPPESVHALDLTALRGPDVCFWSAWAGGRDGPALVGTAALKRLDSAHAELKSMRTAVAWRGQGVATRLLGHVLAEARAAGYQRLSLETGSQPFFAPARVLYARRGFQDCGPFGAYQPDPNSCYMCLSLSPELAEQASTIPASSC